MCSPEQLAPYVGAAVLLAVMSGADWEEIGRQYVRKKFGLGAAESDESAPRDDASESGGAGGG